MREERLCIALDFATREEILSAARRFGPRAGWLKVGLEAFVAEGPSLVRDVAALGPRRDDGDEQHGRIGHPVAHLDDVHLQGFDQEVLVVPAARTGQRTLLQLVRRTVQIFDCMRWPSVTQLRKSG